jgi:hypothetical protein
MSTRSIRLSIALTAAALGSSSAVALASPHHPTLRGAPQMHLVNAHHATLSFAADRIARASSITLPGGNVTRLRASGRHGDDTVYTARVSSRRRLEVGRKYSVTFRLGGGTAVRRLVKLHV